MNLKIAILAQTISPHSGARSVIELARSLARNNQVTIYTKYEKPEKNSSNEHLGNTVNIKSFKRFSPFSSFCKKLLEFKKSNYDIICANTTLSTFLPSAFSGKPLVATYHGTQWNVWSNKMFLQNNFSYFFLPLDIATNILIWLKTFPLFLLSRKTVAVSNYAANEAKRYYFASPKPIYWGSKLKTFKKLPGKTPASQITIISVSRITPYKGFHHLIDVIKKIKIDNLNLIICGSQPQKNYLKMLQKMADKRIKIIVDPTDQKLSQLYKTSDIYATFDKYLFFGMPILEAASFGLPTVAMDFAAASEIVLHQKTGFVAKNHEEFREYLELLIKNKNLRQRLGKNAKEYAKKFTWQKTAQAYEEIFKSVIKESNK